MKSKFLFSDLVLFNRIINNDVKIELPCHISRIEPQDVKRITRSSQSISDGSDDLKYKTKIILKLKCFQNSHFVRTMNCWNDLPFGMIFHRSLKCRQLRKVKNFTEIISLVHS